jgi:hypothetical protein
MINKKRLNEAIKILIEVCGENKLVVPQEIIFSESCSFERGCLAGESKALNNQRASRDGLSVHKDQLGEGSPSELATEKQIKYLYGLGISGFNPKNLTKLEAKKLIEENK